MSSVLISVRALFLFCDEESFSPRLLPIVVAAVVPATVVAIATAPPVVEAAAHCKQKPQTMSKMSSGRKEFIQPKLDVDDDCFPVFREVCVFCGCACVAFGVYLPSCDFSWMRMTELIMMIPTATRMTMVTNHRLHAP